MEIIIEFKDEAKLNMVTSKTIKYFLQMSQEQLTNEIKDRTPVKTSNARNSWTPKLSNNELRISSSVNYMPFLETGTGIFGPRRHRIFPKNATVLHATIDGEELYFTNSRGQPGHHMAEKGAEAFKPKIPNLFGTALMKTTK